MGSKIKANYSSPAMDLEKRFGLNGNWILATESASKLKEAIRSISATHDMGKKLCCLDA